MEGRGHRQHHRPLHAPRLGDFDRPLDGGFVARQHDLPAAIVVCSGADRAGGGLLRNRLCVSSSTPISAAMAPTPTGHRLLHRPAADTQKPRGIGDRQRPRRGERRIFAQRVPGDESRVAAEIDTGFGFERAQRRKRNRHQRRLRIFGQRQRLRRTVPDRLAELLAERGIDFLEHLPRRRKGLGQALAHADRLTALAGKNERRRHALPLKEGRKIPRSRPVSRANGRGKKATTGAG